MDRHRYVRTISVVRQHERIKTQARFLVQPF